MALPPKAKAIPVARGGKFIEKLNLILRDCTDMAKWTKDGKSFSVLKPDAFAEEVLPRYFNTSNIFSFTRQLHLYGFRKRKPERARAVTERSSSSWEFEHEWFQRDHPQLMSRITRKNRSDSRGVLKGELINLKEQVIKLQAMVTTQQTQMDKMYKLIFTIAADRDNRDKVRLLASRKRKATNELTSSLAALPRSYYNTACHNFTSSSPSLQCPLQRECWPPKFPPVDKGEHSGCQDNAGFESIRNYLRQTRFS